MKKVLIALAILFNGYTWGSVKVIAAVDCGQWIQYKKTPALRHQAEFWLLGFLSGMVINESALFKHDFLRDVSAEQIELWMDNYCSNNPLKNVSDGAVTLAFELSAK